MNIEYPITVKGINFEIDDHPFQSFRSVGKFVSIRPVSSICEEEKTYLGLYIGDVKISQSVSYDKESGELSFRNSMGNPAIFVFDLNRVVLGIESWWGFIDNVEDLKVITDIDIENIWYVKALKSMQEENEAE